MPFSSDWIRLTGPSAQVSMPSLRAFAGSSPTPHALMQEIATIAKKYRTPTVAVRVTGKAAYQTGVSAIRAATLATLLRSRPAALALGVAAAAVTG